MTNHLDRASPTGPTPTAPPSSVTSLSVATTLIEALGWSVVSAVAVAMVGFYGHRIGSSWYPQRYEGMPSDIFFIPLGFILGVVVADTARLARPMWRAFDNPDYRVTRIAVITFCCAAAGPVVTSTT
jgi:hypothetical protein